MVRIAALEESVQVLKERTLQEAPSQFTERDLVVWTLSEEEDFLNDRISLSKNGR